MTTFLRVALLTALLSALPCLVMSQGVFIPPQVAFETVNGVTRPIPAAAITVCAAGASGIPCSPVLTNTIFKDAALTQPLTNPFPADANGNYIFAAASGTYTVTVTALGFSGYSYQITLGGSGGGGTVSGTPNFMAKFTGPTTVGNSTCTDDGVTPTRCPDGMNTAANGDWSERQVDAGGVQAGKLVCRTTAGLVAICPPGATKTVFGVALSTVSVGGTVIVCRGGTCHPFAATNVTANDWLIPSLSVAGGVDDTGSNLPVSNGTIAWIAETSVTAGNATQVSFETLDQQAQASAGGTLTPCTIFGLGYYSAVTTLNCITPPTANGFWTAGYNVTGGVALAPNVFRPGIVNRNVSAASDTILYSDRINKVTYTGATAHAVTIPQAGTATFDSNFAFRTKVTGTGPATFTPTTSTVNGAATFVQTIGQQCTWYSDNSNYTTDCWDGKRDCSIVIGADNASSVLVNGDIGPQGSQCYVDNAGTIIEVEVKGDAGTSTALPRKEHGVTNTSLLSGALSTAAAGAIACSNAGGTLGLDGVTTCTNTLNTTTLAAGDFLGMASGVADGTTKRLTVHIIWIESGT